MQFKKTLFANVIKLKMFSIINYDVLTSDEILVETPNHLTVSSDANLKVLERM